MPHADAALDPLAHTAHRPWPLARGPWSMRQTWHDLLFAHWPVSPGALAALVPPALALDTFDGAAWLGVVPFHMTGVRLRGLPDVGVASAFAEINLRTYVRAGDRPGVFFLSLDAASALAVAVARAWYRLPYFRARVAWSAIGAGVAYASRRVHPGAPPAEFRARYRPLGAPTPAAPGTLAHFLTARYCLYAAGGGRLYRGEIHHPAWPLQAAEAEIELNTLAAGWGIALPVLPPLLHFARRLDVRVWAPRRLEVATAPSSAILPP